jgi:hypothetical protein
LNSINTDEDLKNIDENLNTLVEIDNIELSLLDE